MSKPIRSVRLERRSSKSLNVLSGAAGEIFYDADNRSLRVYTDNAGNSILLADRSWHFDNVFSGDYTDLTNKPDLSGFAQTSNLAAVAFSGDYDDLLNLPVLTTSITALTDVVISDLQLNEVLQYNGANWVNVSIADAQNTDTTYTLNAASDPNGAFIQLLGSDLSSDYIKLVEGTNISITRDDASNITISAAVGSLNIDDLQDVDTSTVAPSSGQVLKWNGANWAPANDITAGGAGLDADTLDGQDSVYYLNYNNLSNKPTIPADLTDLDITDGSNGQVLTTDGAGNFSFATVTHPAIPADLLDLGISDGSAGQVLTTNGAGTFTFTTVSGGGGGETYDQSLNTTDDVEFNSVSSATFTNTGTGSPNITSASTITLDAPDGVTIGDFIQLPVLSSPITSPQSGMIAMADGSGWDPGGTATEQLVVYVSGAWRLLFSL
jgi:hypothetical protein